MSFSSFSKCCNCNNTSKINTIYEDGKFYVMCFKCNKKGPSVNDVETAVRCWNIIMKDSDDAINSVVFDPYITPQQKVVYIALLRLSDKSGKCEISIKELSGFFGINKRSVTRIITSLVNKKLIKRISQTSKENLYVVKQ